MRKYLVTWRDSTDLPRAWGYCRDKETAQRQANREKIQYEKLSGIKLTTQKITEVREK